MEPKIQWPLGKDGKSTVHGTFCLYRGKQTGPFGHLSIALGADALYFIPCSFDLMGSALFGVGDRWAIVVPWIPKGGPLCQFYPDGALYRIHHIGLNVQ